MSYDLACLVVLIGSGVMEIRDYGRSVSTRRNNLRRQMVVECLSTEPPTCLTTRMSAKAIAAR
jgi:hypothetical protein